MRTDARYEHYHETSSDWFRENFINYTVDRDRDVHRHRILEKNTGKTGEGFGWSYKDAEKKAWDDLLDGRVGQPRRRPSDAPMTR
jgi:hypothetical protein